MSARARKLRSRIANAYEQATGTPERARSSTGPAVASRVPIHVATPTMTRRDAVGTRVTHASMRALPITVTTA